MKIKAQQFKGYGERMSDLFCDIKAKILAYELAKILIKDENKHVELLHELVHKLVNLIERE